VLGRLGVFWGLVGVTFVLGFAIVRLARIGFDSFSYGYEWYHWLILAVSIVFMAWSEGYKGFQKSYAPRLAARIRYLRDNPRPMRTLLSPLFGMGFFYTTRRRLIGSYLLIVMILIFVLIAHQLPQPWRGILDLGVVVGLSWGLVAILVYSWIALTQDEFLYSPELPEPLESAP
jgi:hypothetical protein